MFGVCEIMTEKFIVMELMEQGSVLSFLEHHKVSTLDLIEM